MLGIVEVPIYSILSVEFVFEGLSVIEVRKAVDNDCRYYVDVHCPEVKALPRDERLRVCGWWADYDACVFYLNLYRRLGGEVFTALINGEVVGEIELLPHDDCLLGPRAYINVLWVKEGERGKGIGTKLVNQGVKWARFRGYKYLDTIPEKESVGFYSKLGFKHIAFQIKAIKKLKPLHYSIDYRFNELNVNEPPLNMKLVIGTYRPGLFTWYSAWEDKYLPPQTSPLAYELVVEGKPIVTLLDYYRENETSLIIWSIETLNDELLRKAILVSEQLAIKAGIAKIFIQTWNIYEDLLRRLGYKIVDNDIIRLSKNIEKDQY